MNGHFEVKDSAYPIGYLRIGEGYKVCDMRNLHPLHSQSIPLDKCKEVSEKANAAIRAGELPQIDGSQEVRDYIKHAVGEF